VNRPVESKAGNAKDSCPGILPKNPVDKVRSRRSTLVCALLASIVLCVAASVTSEAQTPPATPCASLTPVPGPLGYASRSGGSRCEGLYIAHAAAKPLEVLGLYLEPVIRREGVAAVSIAHRNPQKDIVVTAVPIPAETFYRLDARLTAERPTFTVNGADVIFPAGLKFSDLAFTGRTGSQLVPLLVTNSPGPPAAETKSPTIMVEARTSRALKVVMWRIEREGSAPPNWTTCAEDLSGPYRLAKLRFTSSPGAAELVIKAEDNNDLWTGWRIPLSLP
jgi:hypothetical protein